MKSSSFAAVILAMLALMFAGCADQSSNPAAATGNPTDRTYSRDDLQRSGRQTTGESIQAIDPSANISSGGGSSGRP